VTVRVVFLGVLCVSVVNAPAGAQYDLLIRNGRVLDGAGNPWMAADVAITGERIAAVGRLPQARARRVIEATGRYVAPGFIDMLGQSEFTLLVDGQARSKIAQGITTEITGEGGSIAPLNDYLIALDQPVFDRFKVRDVWRTLAQYFARLEKQGIGINLATYVGATQVRMYVLRNDNRAPSAAELEKMKALVDQAMREGAMGLSTSLVYAPASYSSTAEIIELAKVAARYGGLYATHLRSESTQLLEAIDEAVRIGREARIPVEIFHLKAAGQMNWNKMPQVVERIERARAEGVDVAADQYPYIAGATSLDASLPRWALEGGRPKMLERLRNKIMRAGIRLEIEAGPKGWENFYALAGGGQGVMIASVFNRKLLPLQGQRLSQIAATRQQNEIETLFDILVEDEGQTGAIYFLMNEEDVRTALRRPWVSLGLDSPATRTEGPLAEARPHPRGYGSAARWLARYVREEKLLTLEEAVRKMTSLPAQRLGLRDRGLLKPGFFADIAVFDAHQVQDKATFEDPARYAEGFRYVLVNGQLALDDGQFTGALAGRALRGAGFRPRR
jgi:dihydroorotase/N-acyl-D-amino-acid deacylase